MLSTQVIPGVPLKVQMPIVLMIDFMFVDIQNRPKCQIKRTSETHFYNFECHFRQKQFKIDYSEIVNKPAVIDLLSF